MDKKEMISDIKYVIKPEIKNWVLFSHGTFVIFKNINKGDNLAEKAIEHMKKFGSVHPGSEAGDFNVRELENHKGWLVSGYGPNMATLVYPQEIENKNHDTLVVGIFGRTKRDKDSQELEIIHINTE